MINKNAIITDIQRFSINDGPGVRTVVFLKGCNLNCFWCQNPETKKAEKEILFHVNKCIACGECVKVCPNVVKGKTALFTENCNVCGQCCLNCYSQALEIAGTEYNLQQLFELIMKDADIFKLSGGGVTFSGGEPFLQSSYLREALKFCKEHGIGTAVETAAYVDYKYISECLDYIDLVYCDIKIINANMHVAATGGDNALIIDNIKKMATTGKKIIFRTPIIPGFNDDAESISEICDFVLSLNGDYKIELLRFNDLCAEKYTALNRDYSVGKNVLQENYDEKFKILQKIVSDKLTIDML